LWFAFGRGFWHDLSSINLCARVFQLFSLSCSLSFPPRSRKQPFLISLRRFFFLGLLCCERGLILIGVNHSPSFSQKRFNFYFSFCLSLLALVAPSDMQMVMRRGPRKSQLVSFLVVIFFAFSLLLSASFVNATVTRCGPAAPSSKGLFVVDLVLSLGQTPPSSAL